ncbi:hypothetical protein A4X09_0g5482 [Tilletia walkeri]|uniref:Ribosome biogenesis protein NSA1 n=1 Tax=Tilletia walkeri TaxID=117179 RepID=A0A8X7N5P2_9BASI|nr:hypothetical protein A4X09_0g5482 [Tilletia walkeri]
MEVDEPSTSAQPWQSAYRIYVADADGHLKVLRTLPSTPAPPPAKAAPPKKEEESTDAAPQTTDAAVQDDAEKAIEDDEEEEVPTLPFLQIIPIEGRSKIPPPSFSNTSVNASPHAVQKMAAGWLASGQWVLAIARRDASVDVVLPLPQPRSRNGGVEAEEDEGEPQRAVLIASYTEDNMRAGMERWVGLKVGSSGIYACTSAGALRYMPILTKDAEATSTQASHVDLVAGESTVLKLPNAPLTHVLFTTLPHVEVLSTDSKSNSDPTHFLCGGQEVPLSIWHLPSAFASTLAQGPLVKPITAPATNDASVTTEKEVGGEEELSGKQKKRKRQVEARNKAKELREGEVWRAKNLPNDALSLQQKPLISAIAILCPGVPSPTITTASTDEPPALPAGLQIGTATKTGLLRIYAPEPSSHQGKALAEFACLGGKGTEGKKKEAQGVKGTMGIGLIKKGVTSGGIEVKIVEVGRAGGSELFVADTQGKLYVLDWKTQKVLYQYPNIDGAITSLLTIPSTSSSTPQPLLFSTSLDRILRLHSTSEKAVSLHGKANLGRGRGKTLVSVFAGALYDVDPELEGTLPAAPVAAVWDGVVPLPLPGSGSGDVVGGLDGEESEDDDDDDDDDVWEEMDRIGDGKVVEGAEEGGEGKRVVKKKRLAA